MMNTRPFMHWLKNTPFYHDGVKSSELVELFNKTAHPGVLGGDGIMVGRNGFETKYDRPKNLQLVLKTLIGWAFFGCIVLWKIRSFVTS